MLILVDDVGYGDIAAFTVWPNEASTDKIIYEILRIDQLAAEGAMFTSKTDRGVTVPLAATALHQGEKTMPQALYGYDTAFIGKWHLGSHHHEGYRPGDPGFSEVMGYILFLAKHNIGPDHAGKLQKNDVKTLRQVGEMIRKAASSDTN